VRARPPPAAVVIIVVYSRYSRSSRAQHEAAAPQQKRSLRFLLLFWLFELIYVLCHILFSETCLPISSIAIILPVITQHTATQCFKLLLLSDIDFCAPGQRRQ
jgi:Na+/H+ antiporter NhaC